MGKNYFEQIEDYLEKRLDRKSLEAFSQAIRNDPTLKEAVIKEKMANRAIELNGEEELRGMLNSVKAKHGPIKIPEELEPPKEPKIKQMNTNKSVFSKLAGAVAAIVIIGAGWFLIKNASSENIAATNKIYSQYIQDPNSAGTKSGDTWEAAPELNDGVAELVKFQNFDEAIKKFKTIPENSADYISAQYYLAHAYLKKEDYTSAMPILDGLTSTPHIPLYVDYENLIWNRMVTCYATGNKEKGAELLKMMTSNNRHPKQKMAIEFKKSLGIED